MSADTRTNWYLEVVIKHFFSLVPVDKSSPSKPGDWGYMIALATWNPPTLCENFTSHKWLHLLKSWLLGTSAFTCPLVSVSPISCGLPPRWPILPHGETNGIPVMVGSNHTAHEPKIGSLINLGAWKGTKALMPKISKTLTTCNCSLCRILGGCNLL